LTRAREIVSSTWALGIAVFALTWGGSGAPFVGIDPSWHMGLNVGLDQGIDHGEELLFTYGPLGFMKSGLMLYEWPARIAGAYGLVAHLALSLSLVWAARRSFPLPVAVALALIAAVLIRGDGGGVLFRTDATVPVVALVWCVAALRDDAPSWAPRLVAYAGGFVAAIELLAKLNTGVVVLALVAVTVAAIEPDRRRNLIGFGTTFAVSVAALWLLAGQGLGDVGAYLGGAFEIVSGYSSAMRQEAAGRGEDYVVGGLALVLLVSAAWVSTRTQPRRTQIAAAAVVALYVLAAYKSGFVRHSVFHAAAFFATILGGCLAFRLPLQPGLRYAAALSIAAVGIVAGLTTHRSGDVEYPMADPIANLGDGATRLATLMDGGRLADEIAANRAQMTAQYDLDPRTLELVREGSVHVDSWEAGVAWAYGLEWRPLPVFQTYSAYTPALDERNADALASPDGPERILRQRTFPVDNRYPGFESPAAAVQMLCNFRAVRTTERWQTLERVLDRCGEPSDLGTVEGGSIRVPRPGRDEIVIGHVDGVEVDGLERALSALHRARSRQIIVDSAPYTLVPGTAADGLLLAASPRVDFPRPFALAPNAREISLEIGGKPVDDVEVEFLSVPVRPEPSGGR
jgi:hypothetical protein